MDLGSFLISKYNKVTDKFSTVIKVVEELELIRNGFYKELVEEARLYYNVDKGKYGILKKKLPAVSFSGTFNEDRKAEKITTYNSLLVLDVDNLSELETIEIKKQLANDKYIIAIWISPSGHGLKFLIFIDNDNVSYHKDAFDSAVTYFTQNYNVKIDLSGSDPSRLCFCSYDSEMIIKENFLPFPILTDSLNPVSSTKEVKSKLEVLHHSKKKLFNSQKNIASDRDIITKIIRFLKRRNISITSDYDSWYRVALGLANTFTYDLGSKYYLELCSLDKEKHDEEKSKNILQYAYRNRRENVVNLASIIYMATQKGFVLHRGDTKVNKQSGTSGPIK